MDLRKLEYFLAAVQRSSFKAAAEQVHVSPPALTKGIQALEQDLGLALFHRKRGSTVLTEAGEALLPRARRLLDEAEQVRVDMARLRHLETGRVRIGCGPIVVQTSLNAALAELSALHPGIQVIVSTGNWSDLTGQLLGFEIDLVGADIGEAEQDPRFRVRPLRPEPLIWLAAPDHPLACTGGPVSLEQVLAHPLALPKAPEHMVRAIARHYGENIASALANPRIRSESYMTLIATVRRSRSLTAAPLGIAEREDVRASLVRLAVRDWRLQSRPGLITLAERAPSAAHDALIEAFLRQDAAAAR